MSIDDDDPELVLAIELSKKTLQDDEARRQLSCGPDLINLNGQPLQERQRMEQINSITRLFSQPIPIHSIQRASSSLVNNNDPPLPPLPAQPAYPNVQFNWNQPQLNQPQLNQPQLNQPQLNQPHAPFPPNCFPWQPSVLRPSGSLLQIPRSSSPADAPPTTYAPTLPPSISTLNSSASCSSSNAFTKTLPAPPVRIRKPSSLEEKAPLPPPRLSSVFPHQPSSSTKYLNQLIVPYAVIPSSGSTNGDLIDFSDVTSSTRDEDIWREFDPLHKTSVQLFERSSQTVTQPPTAPDRPPLPRGSSVDAPATTSGQELRLRNSCPHRSREVPQQEDVILERAPRSIKTVAEFEFIQRLPPSFEQLESLECVEKEDKKLRFVSPIAAYQSTNVHTVQVIISKDHTWPRLEEPHSLTLTCDTSNKVEFLLQEVLATFLPEDDLMMDKYGLKIFGLDEVLDPDSLFGCHLYVGKCLLLGHDIKLQIGRIDQGMTASQIESSHSTLTEQVRPTSIIDIEDVQKVLTLLEAEMQMFEESVIGGSALDAAQHGERVRQFLKLLCSMCSNVESIEMQQKKGQYFAAVEKTFPMRKAELLSALYDLLHLYCNSTMSIHGLPPRLEEPLSETDVGDSTEHLRIIFHSIHNIPEEWKNEIREFFLAVHLYHGGTAMDVRTREISKKINMNPALLFPTIPLHLYAAFDKELCTVPREARYVIVLSGSLQATSPAPVAVDTGAAATLAAEPTRRRLAYTTLPLFDYHRKLRRGQHLLPLRPIPHDEQQADSLHPWGGLPVILNAHEPLLHLSLPAAADHIVRFPHIEADPENVARSKAFTHDISSLNQNEQETLMDLVESGLNISNFASVEDAEILWQRRHYLSDLPEALPLVLSAVNDWSIAFLPSIYEVLELWMPLSPILATQLLLPSFPDERVRLKAVHWIESASKISSETMYTFLPLLVEALRFESFENSALAKLLLELSFKDAQFAFEIYWQLQQRIDHVSDSDFAYAQRCSLLQMTLLRRHSGDGLAEQIIRQRRLLSFLDDLQKALREEMSNDKAGLLRTQLGVLDAELLQNPVALPLLPSFNCSGVVVNECSIFNSAAKPLKIVFRGIHDNFAVIHKNGDDMRQDSMVLHLVSLMVRIWKERNLDLRMIIFRCMSVGFRKGMGELVGSCSTLCAIQKSQGGLKGVFQEDALNKWLIAHNSSEFSFKQALDNFQRSCAGWCVATYVLGIGDRHNDNILVTTKGHVFHIDFGKYLGDWQMAGAFKRDRVPFVFTSEMYYVVNQGTRQTENYQIFIDYCTKAFNYLRAKSSTILNLLNIMACSNIPGINMDAIQFVESKLLLSLSENDATIQFTKMLQESLQSAFPRLNFAIHAFAQVFSGSTSTSDNNTLSFVPKLCSEASDGRIVKVSVTGIHKVQKPTKIYMYKMEVKRRSIPISSIIYRSFQEFSEFYVKLRRRFPMMNFPPLNHGSNMRSNVLSVAQRRMVDVRAFVEALFRQGYEISHCDLTYTFFHSLLRDNSSEMINAEWEESAEVNSRRKCHLSVKMQYRPAKQELSVFVSHAKSLAELPPGTPPDTYVKTYLIPDVNKTTKLKTPIVKCSCSPTYNAELVYENIDSLENLSSRILNITVWYAASLRDNSKQYSCYFPLKRLAEKLPDRRGCRSIEEWLSLEKFSV